jgi:hypothetical protein
MIGYDRVFTPRDLAPSVLNQIALRELRWIPLEGCCARTYMLGARFGVRAADLMHLAFFMAHAAYGMSRVAVATLATHPMRADATGDCMDRALRGDRALNIYRTVRLLFKS